MTPDDFRRFALALPEAVEQEHMGHPDFRVGGRIFASLGAPDAGHGMLKLTPQQQARAVAGHPRMFAPIAGGWGRNGATAVVLRHATRRALQDGLLAAWRNTAPPRLLLAIESPRDDEPPAPQRQRSRRRTPRR